MVALSAAALASACTWVLAKPHRPMNAAKGQSDMETLAGGRGLRAEHCITVMRPAGELYEQWRDLGRLPEIMRHLESVTVRSAIRSHWVARGPRGIRVEWEADLVADEPGRLIAWRSVEDADVDNAGSVSFTPAPGNRGTEVRVIVSYAAPAGRLGAAVVSLLGVNVERQIREDLRRFKQRMETSEVASVTKDAGSAEHAPAGR